MKQSKSVPKPKKNIPEKSIAREIDADYKSLLSASRNELSGAASKYLSAVVSPSTSKPCGIPTLIGGEGGRTGSIKLKVAGTLGVGTADFGYIVLGIPQNDGFYNNRTVGMYTTASFTGGAVSNTSLAGTVNNIVFADSPYAAGAVGNETDIVSYRLVGIEVSILPIGSALSQDGQIVLLENVNLYSLGGLSFSQLRSFKNARTLSGIKFSDYEEKPTLNTHPRQYANPIASYQFSSPFAFNWSNASNVLDTGATLLANAGIIAISASAGLSFEFEVIAIYENRGFRVPNPRYTPSDSRGMDLVMAIFNQKKLSGYFSSPEKVKDAYLSTIVKLKHEETKESSYDRASGRDWHKLWNSAKWAWDTTRKIAGMI